MSHIDICGHIYTTRFTFTRAQSSRADRDSRPITWSREQRNVVPRNIFPASRSARTRGTFFSASLNVSWYEVNWGKNDRYRYRKCVTELKRNCPLGFSWRVFFFRGTRPLLWQGLNSSCWRNVTQLDSNFMEFNRGIMSVSTWTIALKSSSRWSVASSLERRLYLPNLHSLSVCNLIAYVQL